jgi:nucleotide-binding universal stress UspA family protein
MERIVIGTDGSAIGQAALRWAAQLAAATRGTLIVVSAWQPPFAEIDPPTHAELLEESRKVLDAQWCAPVRDLGVAYEPVVVEGDPRRVLLARADEDDADLLVVGAHGAGHHKHPLHLGSVTHHLVHHTTRPLVAVPPHVAATSPKRIVVGVDGSDGSARAVSWCVEHAPALGADVLAVHSELPLAEWVPHSDPQSWYHIARQHVHEWAAPLRDAGLHCQEFVVEHEPATGLADTAIREDADLLVIGARGRGGFTGLRLGSTALEVLHQSGLPVVLVPTPAH